MDLNRERELIQKAKSDPKAFGALYDRYYAKIFHWVLLRVAQVDAACDITSETFYKALKNLGKFTWCDISFSAWLYRIATSQIADWYRGESKCISLDRLIDQSGWEPEDKQNVEEEIIRAEESLGRHKKFLAVQKLIAALDIKYQEVLALRFFENKKIIQIAKILGKKEGTIKSLLSRAITRIRKLVWLDGERQKVQPFKLGNVLNIEANRYDL